MLEGTGAGKVGGCDDSMVTGIGEVDRCDEVGEANRCDGIEKGVLCDSDMVTNCCSRKNKHEKIGTYSQHNHSMFCFLECISFAAHAYTVYTPVFNWALPRVQNFN